MVASFDATCEEALSERDDHIAVSEQPYIATGPRGATEPSVLSAFGMARQGDDNVSLERFSRSLTYQTKIATIAAEIRHMRRHVSEDVYMISLWYLQLLDVLNEIGGEREINLVGEVLDALHAPAVDVSRISRLLEILQTEVGAWMRIPCSDDIDAFLRVRFDQERSAHHLFNGVAAAEAAWAARVAAAGTVPLPAAAAPSGRRNMAPP
eukprot:s2927_g3.t1